MSDKPHVVIARRVHFLRWFYQEQAAMSDKPHVVSEVCYRELAEKCDRLRDENERLKEQIRHYQQTLANLAKDREPNIEF